MYLAPLLGFVAAFVAVFACWDLVMSLDPDSFRRRWRKELQVVEAAGKYGRAPTGRERVRLIILLSVAATAAGFLIGGLLLACLFLLLAPVSVMLLLQLGRYRYRAQLRLGAPPFARALADALRAGYSVRRGLGDVATNLQGPIANELVKVSHALELGETVESALESLRRSAACSEFDALTAGILLQRDAGGDLAALLTELALAMEASLRLRRDAKTSTSQARFTAGLLLALPIAAMALVELASPGYLVGVLENPISLMMTIASFVLQLIGIAAVALMARVAK